MSQKSVKKSLKPETQSASSQKSARKVVDHTDRPHSPVVGTDLAGRPLKERQYVHLRDKPDFYESAPNHGKGQGHFKKLHDVPFAAKIEDSLKVSTGRKRIPEPRAQHDIPLKIGAVPAADEPSRKAGKKQIVPWNLPSQRQDRGKKIIPKPNSDSARPASARRHNEGVSVPRETIEYMRLQIEKQSNFEKEIDRETAYRRKTPERKNAELMGSIMAYKFVKFPADKLTDKINRVEVTDAAERSLSTRRSSSYYGKRCRQITLTQSQTSLVPRSCGNLDHDIQCGSDAEDCIHYPILSIKSLFRPIEESDGDDSEGRKRF